jgi:hypothetical protein
MYQIYRLNITSFHSSKSPCDPEKGMYIIDKNSVIAVYFKFLRESDSSVLISEYGNQNFNESIVGQKTFNFLELLLKNTNEQP